MKCFVIMPFSQEFNDVYSVIRSAAGSVEVPEAVEVKRLDEIRAAGAISDDLIRELNDAMICIADVTGSNPNVMWEVGYALALQKPTLILTQDIAALPFDIKNLRTIKYDRGALHFSLHAALAIAFRETVGRFEDRKSKTQAALPPKRTPVTIPIAGSRQLDRTKAARRLELFLSHFLRSDMTWYSGSAGDADWVALKYLTEHQQQVVAVGHHSLDISSPILELIESAEIRFVDASKEQLPKGFGAPNERALLFLTRADLLVVIWDGKSSGTRDLIGFYRTEQRDHFVIFVQRCQERANADSKGLLGGFDAR
jgi:hypothetical protein